MNGQWHRWLRWLTALYIPILIAAGCDTEEPTETALSQTPAPAVFAELTALKTNVQRLRENNPVFELGEEEKVDIQQNDQIAVGEHGRGLLTFEEQLRVELFSDTDIRVSEARPELADSMFVRLEQSFGHTRAELNSLRELRLKLETDYATITYADSDTEVVVGHSVSTTDITTLRGEAEVEAEGKVVTVRAGEATYVMAGEAPHAVICADLGALRQWLDDERGTVKPDYLGDLVADWAKEPCPAEIARTTPTATPATPTATSQASTATPETPTATPAPSATPIPTTTPTPTAVPTSVPLPPPDGMVPIQGGLFEVGVDEGDDHHMATQQIELPAFWIDEAQVTNARYQGYLNETGVAPPLNWPGKDNHPVKGVTWNDAVAYCEWKIKRLPTEAEWEVAARGPGPDPVLYPWGNDPSAGGLTANLPPLETYPVGGQPFNISPFGVCDMAGNVWEWVGDAYGTLSDGNKILRGGRYGFIRDMAYRQEATPNDERFVPVAGFRCAADQVEGE